MAENVLYADLNLPEPTRPRILTVPDVQGSGCTYAEVKVKAQDTNAAANCKSSGKSCCSRKHVAILVVIILVLVLAVYLIITYGPTANSQQDSTTTIPEEALGCPPPWKKHGRKCYFFSPEAKAKDLKGFRAECTAKGSDLVVIDSREELSYLLSQSRFNYYLLGLTYSPEEQKWKWINTVEHDPAMFRISRIYPDYLCTVIGFGEVQSAPCGGSTTTQNMCEKAATMTKRLQKES
ncbi:killer cell lectin-like receptor subfamily B member 1B allele B [Motacilla alba alba]|uniref:killer cell lectin-like receptor subfamily B member 1B allele B n=1 Tax=Motacilla alba alba TaxID=1094192 RepID=UPI0018D50A1D|nr:killer cell lectin-like receptor subfamily B member 1B allele B [Motacilla alba alba]